MIYFDNAATTFPKPPVTIQAALSCIREYGGNPGRGAHRLALAASDIIYSCREALSSFLGVGAPERVIFTQNTTYALNMAIKGVLKSGDHVLISELEHNAVLRPVFALSKENGISYDVFPVLNRNNQEIIGEIKQRLQSNTVAVICTHASNICSVTLPLKEIGNLCRNKHLYFIVDAAQSAGHLPIDMTALHIDILAAPGHKGLLGIQGCGILAMAKNISLKTLIEGGSGVDSLSSVMPDAFPERLEAGTLPTPAIAALGGGLSYLQGRGVADVESTAKSLFLAAKERIEALEGYEIYQKNSVGSVLLFNKRGIPADKIARVLDKNGICTRAGLHCAPLAHRAVGAPPSGAVRLSFGPFNTIKEIDRFRQILKDECAFL